MMDRGLHQNLEGWLRGKTAPAPPRPKPTRPPRRPPPKPPRATAATVIVLARQHVTVRGQAGEPVRNPRGCVYIPATTHNTYPFRKNDGFGAMTP